MALFSNAVVIGFGYAINKIMRSQQAQISGDASRILAPLVWIVVRLRVQALGQVLVAYSLDQEFAGQTVAEHATILRTNRPQGTKLSSLTSWGANYFGCG